MRWFILFVSLMVSIAAFTGQASVASEEENWTWIIICEVFSETRQNNVEVYRETFFKVPQFFTNASGFTNGKSWDLSGKIFYVGWGDRSCIIMSRETHENRR